MYIFYIQTAVKKSSIPKKTYKNPISLAKEFKEIIDLGKAKNQSKPARIKGISRARVTQILNLLKLDKSIIDKLEKIGDPMDEKAISERELRKLFIKANTVVLTPNNLQNLNFYLRSKSNTFFVS